MIRVTDPGRGRYAEVRGHARPVLDAYSIPALWSARERCWHVRRDRLPDLLAAAQESGVPVRMRDEK